MIFLEIRLLFKTVLCLKYMSIMVNMCLNLTCIKVLKYQNTNKIKKFDVIVLIKIIWIEDPITVAYEYKVLK